MKTFAGLMRWLFLGRCFWCKRRSASVRRRDYFCGCVTKSVCLGCSNAEARTASEFSEFQATRREIEHSLAAARRNLERQSQEAAPS